MADADRVQDELRAACDAREEHGRLTRRIAAAQPGLEELERRVDTARARLADESADVERLESFSTAKVWATLKGSHLTDVERETAEREAARYAVAEAEARRDAMLRETAAWESRRAELGDVEARYRAALAAKESWLAENGDASAARLAEVAERRGRLEATDREAREAFAAGEAAARLLDEAAGLLGSAGSWSSWDTFGGGGMLTDMMKYDKVDRATSTLRRADHALAAFSAELADADLPPVQGVRVDQIMRTFDVWFDNIFSDMAVRSRIGEAADRVAAAQHQVRQALTVLADKGREIRAELAALEAERERLILA